jgi:hypothetical protein
VIAPSAFGAGVAWSPVAATGPTVMPLTQSEVQRLWIDAEGGTYTLKFGAATTGPIAFDADSVTVQAALNGLSSISGGGGSVSVTGGPGAPGAENPYSIAFGGSLANSDVPQLVTNRAALTGAGQSAAVGTFVPGGTGTTTLAVYAQNIGGIASTGGITMKVKLPTGMSTTVTPSGGSGSEKWNCTTGAQTEFTCTLPMLASVRPGLTAPAIDATLTATPGTESGLVEFEVEGGGGAQASGNLPLTVSATPARPGIQSFAAGAYDANGDPDVGAGDHPYTASAAIFANTKRSPIGIVIPAGNPRNILVDLPPGFLGNPIAVPQCPESVTDYECPLETVVGIATIFIQAFGGSGSALPVYNTEAPAGYPAKFRFDPNHQVPISAVGNLRSEGDYGLTVGSLNTPQIAQVYGTFFTFWGAPADPSHDSSRCVFPSNNYECEASSAPNTAFLTNATNCAEEATAHPITFLHMNSWEEPGFFDEGQAEITPVTGCENLHFEDNFTFEPSETKSDSSASFKTSLTVPSEGLTDPAKLTTPEIRNTTIKFPEGVVLNAAAASGLQACSESQIGLLNEIDPSTGLPKPEPMPNPIRFSKEENHCPEASKIGTGELKTALLEDTLHGTLYLAAQGKGNPFGSLFAIYLVIEDPRNGIFIKLPGEVEPDPKTGQMTVSFENLPQLPFTRLDLTLKGGSNSALATPTTCGKYVTTTVNTPWSAPESGPPFETNEEGKGFEISGGPNGGACAATPGARPFNLGLNAGSQGTQAGAHSPFTIQVTRPAGNQELSSLDIVTPTGLTATLKGVPYCSDAQIRAAEGMSGTEEQNGPACPAASQVGTTEVGAGSGPAPFYAPGKLYLAGPYKGAPLSIVAITPALAGPFDLGDVVVRTALFVNPETAQITARSDQLPEFLKGVQLRIRDVRINLDRSDFTLNPTSCEPKSVGVTVHGNSGATANLSQRFQVGGCEALPFEPNLKLKVLGGTKRNAKPKLRAELTAKPGEANIATAQVNLPHSEFLEQNHIKTVCTRVQFAEGDGNGSACPAGSIYGHATAWSPLLEKPLEGNVYLRSNGGERKLPDLVAALDGQVDIALWGKVDSGPNHGIRNTFEVVPDAPVSRFVLEMNGGKKGLLVNSENLCAKKAQRQAIVRFTGQNGKVHAFKPVVQNQCKKHKKGKKKKAHKTKRAQSRAVGLSRWMRVGW